MKGTHIQLKICQLEWKQILAWSTLLNCKTIMLHFTENSVTLNWYFGYTLLIFQLHFTDIYVTLYLRGKIINMFTKHGCLQTMQTSFFINNICQLEFVFLRTFWSINKCQHKSNCQICDLGGGWSNFTYSGHTPGVFKTQKVNTTLGTLIYLITHHILNLITVFL